MTQKTKDRTDDSSSDEGFVHDSTEALLDSMIDTAHDLQPVDPDDVGPETVEGTGWDSRREVVEGHPLFINDLLGSQVRRNLIDFFLTSADPDHDYSKGELTEKTSVSRASIYEEVDFLLEYNICVDEADRDYPMYRLNTDSPVVQALQALNTILASQYDEDRAIAAD